MDAVEFLMNKTRFCKNADCQECVIYNECDTMFGTITRKQAEKIVDVVDKWAKEHLIKTRQSEFLKMFPDAAIGNNGALSICPATVSSEYRANSGGCIKGIISGCARCHHDYWLQEVE